MGDSTRGGWHPQRQGCSRFGSFLEASTDKETELSNNTSNLGAKDTEDARFFTKPKVARQDTEVSMNVNTVGGAMAATMSFADRKKKVEEVAVKEKAAQAASANAKAKRTLNKTDSDLSTVSSCDMLAVSRGKQKKTGNAPVACTT